MGSDSMKKRQIFLAPRKALCRQPTDFCRLTQLSCKTKIIYYVQESHYGRSEDANLRLFTQKSPLR